MSDLFNRPGRFEISDNLLRELKAREALRKLFSDVVPVRVEHDYMRKVHVYYGYSERFELSDYSAEAPPYNVSITSEGDVEFLRGGGLTHEPIR